MSVACIPLFIYHLSVSTALCGNSAKKYAWLMEEYLAGLGTILGMNLSKKINK